MHMMVDVIEHGNEPMSHHFIPSDEATEWVGKFNSMAQAEGTHFIARVLRPMSQTPSPEDVLKGLIAAAA